MRMNTALAVWLCLLPQSAWAQSVPFSRADLATGTGPGAVAAGDFNGDGKPDLAVADYAQGRISVFLASKTGGFGAKIDFTSAAKPDALAVGDFDRDGKLDLVVASESGAIGLFRGNGDGTFAPAVSISTGAPASAVVAADFNADGKLDVAFTALAAAKIIVLPGNGDGTFAAAKEFPVGPSPKSILAADFDRDGRLDLVVASSGIGPSDSGGISLLRGKGDASFEPATKIWTGGNPVQLVVGCFSANDKLSLVFVETGQGGVWLLPGTGGATFADPVRVYAGRAPVAVAAADFNRDGKTDLALVDADANTIPILLGLGNNSFNHAQDLSGAGGPRALLAADLNGDGVPDLVSANMDANTISVFTNRTTATDPPLSRLLTSSGASWGGLVNFNSDGKSYFNLSADSFQCNAMPSGANYKDAFPTISGNGVVAFQSDRDGTGFRIFVVNLDGTGLRQITSAKGLSDAGTQADVTPAISRDGTKIAFLRRTDPAVSGYDIYVIGVDGAGLRRITTYQPGTSGGIANIAWNNDGTKLAFRGMRVDAGLPQQVLGIINPDGTGEKHLAAWPSIGWPSSGLDWSADGSKIFLAGDAVQDPNVYHIFAYPSLTETRIATTDLVSPCTGSGCARFSPDGQWIAYPTASGAGSSPAFIRVDGTGRTVLSNILLAAGQSLFWGSQPALGTPDHVVLSPDPLWIWSGHSEKAIASLYDAGGALLVQAAAGWQLPSLNGASPRVSPTGEVFAGPASGDWELDAVNAGKAGHATVKVGNAPDLAIAATHTGNFQVGALGIYALTVSNAADSVPSLGTITVVDTLPVGMKFVSAGGTGWNCAAASPVVTCTSAGRISSGASSTILVTVTVESAAYPSATNVATVSGGGDANPANNSTSDPTVVAATNPIRITAVNVAGGGAVVAPNTWIEIHGSGLAPDDLGPNGLTWGSAPEFASGRMPTQLRGVGVTLNGNPAYIYYVSPTQLNVLTPLVDVRGAVQLQVTNGAITSAPYPLEQKGAAPAFLLLGTSRYITAQHTDYSLLGPASMSVPGYTFTPARPGETIILYGSGFGLPDTALIEGSATQFAVLAPPEIRIGGVPATVASSAVVSPGLYQFNVVVPPAAADGDNAVTAAYVGFMTPAGTAIAVER